MTATRADGLSWAPPPAASAQRKSRCGNSSNAPGQAPSLSWAPYAPPPPPPPRLPTTAQSLSAPPPLAHLQARGSDLRVHFKNTRESAHALRGMSLVKAKAYMQAVIDHKRCVPFLRFNGGVGRTGQAKNEGNSIGQGRWPKKSAEILLGLLLNAESNAEGKGLDTEALYVSHVQVNQAQRGRRRCVWEGGRACVRVGGRVRVVCVFVAGEGAACWRRACSPARKPTVGSQPSAACRWERRARCRPVGGER